MTDKQKPKFTLGDRVYYVKGNIDDFEVKSFIIEKMFYDCDNFHYSGSCADYSDSFYGDSLFPTLEALKAHLHAQVDALAEPKE